MKGLAFIAAVVAAAFTVGWFAHLPATPRQRMEHQRVETIYIQNKSPRYMSNKTIRRDIPAWEKAANQDFAPLWHTPQVRIVLGKAPRGAISAVFQKAGDIEGALAYHTLSRGAPQIVVYTGIGDFYGYSNSVSFTHELFETLGDEFVAGANIGEAPYIYVGQEQHRFPFAATFINEACDPVEAYSYTVHHVSVSDFVTPDWWNDGTHTGLDFMGVLHHPFQIAHGGYALYVQSGEWQQIVDFRHAGPDAAGFLKGEQSVEGHG